MFSYLGPLHMLNPCVLPIELLKMICTLASFPCPQKCECCYVCGLGSTRRGVVGSIPANC